MEDRRDKLIEVMKKIATLRKKRDQRKAKEQAKRGDKVQYHGPYTDACGQSFFFPKGSSTTSCKASIIALKTKTTWMATG